MLIVTLGVGSQLSMGGDGGGFNGTSSPNPPVAESSASFPPDAAEAPAETSAGIQVIDQVTDNEVNNEGTANDQSTLGQSVSDNSTDPLSASQSEIARQDRINPQEAVAQPNDISSSVPSAQSIWPPSFRGALTQQGNLGLFINQLQQAIATRDYRFLEAVTVDDEVIVGDNYYAKSTPIVFSTIPLNENDPRLRSILERALTTGCTPYPNAMGAGEQWICPESIQSAPEPEQPLPLMGLIQAEAVNIRATPSLEGDIIDTASQEVVVLDHEAVAAWSSTEWDAIAARRGWYPIIREDQQGYVSSPYVDFFSNQNVLLLQQNNQWYVAFTRSQSAHKTP